MPKIVLPSAKTDKPIHKFQTTKTPKINSGPNIGNLANEPLLKEFEYDCHQLFAFCFDQLKLYKNPSIINHLRSKQVIRPKDQLDILAYLSKNQIVFKSLSIINKEHSDIRSRYNIQFVDGNITLTHVLDWFSYWDYIVKNGDKL